MRTTIPQTDLSIYPLCLGGNVFGWSADEAQSHDVLDAFASHGGNFIDTADVYSEWKDGNKVTLKVISKYELIQVGDSIAFRRC